MNQLALMLTAYLALVGQPDNLKPVGDDEWQSYKLTYDKWYENEQIESLRRSVYAVNKAKLETKQAQLKQSNASYEVGINKFTDQIENETNRPIKDYNERANRNSVEAYAYIKKILKSIDDDPAPAAFDWRQVKNRVSKVKDQGNCESSYAFAVAGVLEGQEMGPSLNWTNFIELSAQNLVDCAGGGDGCLGMITDVGYSYVSDNGLQDDKSYPYVGVARKCKFNEAKSVWNDKGKGYFDLLHFDEETIKNILYAYGPLSVDIDPRGLKSYQSGIFSHQCVNIQISVLLVGYGTDPKYGDFWIVKNSWGEKWGEGGYFRMQRGKDTACVTQRIVIPQI